MEEKKNLWSSYDEAAKKELHEINEKYKACLDAGKTERECVKLAVEMAKEAGYQDIKDVCLLYTSPSPRDGATSRMPSSA